MSAITTTRVEMKLSPRLLDVIGRELVVDDGLQRKGGHHSTGNSNRGTDGENVIKIAETFFGIPAPNRGDACHRAATNFERHVVCPRGETQGNAPSQIGRHLRKRISPTAQETRNVGFTVIRLAQNDRGHRMKAYFEFRDNSKISTASAKGPGEVGVFVGIGAHHRCRQRSPK
jgi:hypothetical protein